MEQENQNVVIEDGTQNYVNTIADLKKNSVSKDLYNQALAREKDLLSRIANGAFDSAASTDTVEITLRDKDTIRKEMCNGDLTNLQYVADALELRKVVMANGEPDPFIGQGQHLNATVQDYATAQGVADVLQECVDAAQGDPQAFTAELMRRTADVKLPGARY